MIKPELIESLVDKGYFVEFYRVTQLQRDKNGKFREVRFKRLDLSATHILPHELCHLEEEVINPIRQEGWHFEGLKGYGDFIILRFCRPENPEDFDVPEDYKEEET
jgi:hypothetical protein